MDKQTAVLQTLAELKAIIPKYATRNEQVSNWSVGMQVEHCLRGTIGICRAVANSEPWHGRVKPNAMRRLILLAGFIPRGRGRAPEAALPKKETTELQLNQLLARAMEAVPVAAESDCNGWWEHFAFGVMKRDDALRFVEIHNRHHIKIIQDILTRPD